VRCRGYWSRCYRRQNLLMKMADKRLRHVHLELKLLQMLIEWQAKRLHAPSRKVSSFPLGEGRTRLSSAHPLHIPLPIQAQARLPQNAKNAPPRLGKPQRGTYPGARSWKNSLDWRVESFVLVTVPSMPV